MKCALDELMKLDEKNDTPDVVRDTLEARGGEIYWIGSIPGSLVMWYSALLPHNPWA